MIYFFKGLFYELAANPVLRDMCYEAAMKLTTSLSKKTFVAASSVSKSTEAGDTEDSKEREVETIAPDVVGQFRYYSCLTLHLCFS